MSAAPRVSVIIIFLNEERFLAQAIHSVRAQSFTDWELILVDDGSIDGSSAIAHAAADGERVRVVEHPGHANRGMSASRNAGIAEAQGEFIAFLDADDIWLPHKLDEQLALFDAIPEVDMIYGRTWIWHQWEAGAERADYFYDLGVSPDRLYPPMHLLPLLIYNKAQTPTSINAIMRRSLVDRVGGFEEAFRGMFEDQVFFAKTHLVGNCYVDDRFWAKYRQHLSSCSALSAGRLRDLRARGRFLLWLGRYLRHHRVENPYINRALLSAWVELAAMTTRAVARKLLGRA